MADRLAVTDGYVDLRRKNEVMLLTDNYMDSVISAQQPLVEAYEQRLQDIADTCVRNDIKLILITQPILFGAGKDSVTGTDLETYKVNSSYNGKLIWKLLEQYNNVTRKVALERNLLLIDLAQELPKSSVYFYDICHFSNEGAKAVSDIIYRELKL